VSAARKQRWQQATALVSLSTAGAMTGVAFAHGTAADLTSPASMPAHLLAFKKPSGPAASRDGALRSAIVSAAESYLRLAQGKTPAQMEALIWQDASSDGADHGESCAAFASLTLEAGAQAIGQQSWVTGGTSYPWPLHQWADVRVDPNPQSPGIISVLQDAEAHHRWHPLGDGYVPQPGDWVLFAGHVEVVTKYSGGVLYTIGGDSMPNLSVNAHHYDAPLGAQGVAGFVDNGDLGSAKSPAPAAAASISSQKHTGAQQGQADIPGMVAPAGVAAGGVAAGGVAAGGVAAGGVAAPDLAQGSGSHAGHAASVQPVLLGTAAIPGAQATTRGSAGSSSSRYSRSGVAPSPQKQTGTAAQQGFIQQVAAGAIAAQREYGVPAAVTIAQAIDESGWGQSQLAAQDNNLFGIKGSGPAGSVMLPTQEFENGQWVTISAPFRVYSSVAQSISDHSLLLATSSSYKQAMADRADPDAFANALTGIYATDPNYGASLINIMRLYNLYRYDAGTQAAPHAAAPAGSVMGAPARAASRQSGTSGDSGVLPDATQGVAGYGPALGTARNASASPNVALQSNSSEPAAIPGAAAPAGSSTGRARHGVSGRGTVAPQRSGTESPESGSAARATARAGLGAAHAAGQSAARSGAAARPAARSGAAQSRATAGGSTAGGSTAGGSRSGGSMAGGSTWGGARIPGLVPDNPGAGQPTVGHGSVTSGPRNARVSTRRYTPQIPHAVTTAFITTAKTPLRRSEPLYRDVASDTGVSWQLLAACDWMQCRAQPGHSAVYGEKLGTKNTDGSVYRTKADALAQCARDLIILSSAVYAIELTDRIHLSVLDLAKVFAAFRWGRLLAAHQVSALDFPYSVQGLTARHMKMRWPDVPDAPGTDKPRTRFPMAFGAVPVVLGLDYRALA
jgi:flagellum-specific peptidoglycan hydrolase FlgJ